MKFYYNGELIRTSKNHIYTHAVIDTLKNECKGCRANKQTAESIISSEISRLEKEITECKSAIKALGQGKRYYVVKMCRRSYPIYFEKNDTVEKYEDHIKWYINKIEEIKATWKVVELEAR